MYAITIATIIDFICVITIAIIIEEKNMSVYHCTCVLLCAKLYLYDYRRKFRSQTSDNMDR